MVIQAHLPGLTAFLGAHRKLDFTNGLPAHKQPLAGVPASFIPVWIETPLSSIRAQALPQYPFSIYGSFTINVYHVFTLQVEP